MEENESTINMIVYDTLKQLSINPYFWTNYNWFKTEDEKHYFTFVKCDVKIYDKELLIEVLKLSGDNDEKVGERADYLLENYSNGIESKFLNYIRIPIDKIDLMSNELTNRYNILRNYIDILKISINNNDLCKVLFDHPERKFKIKDMNLPYDEKLLMEDIYTIEKQLISQYENKNLATSIDEIFKFNKFEDGGDICGKP